MPRSLSSGFAGRPPAPPDDRWEGDGGHGEWGASRRASFTGLLVLVAATTMTFSALTSAYVVRRGISGDWSATPLPPVLWVNTGVLLVSSALLEAARACLKSGRRAAFNAWWTAATVAGVLFLLGQGLAWRELHAAGYYLASNPSSSFFYLLTAAHAIHLLGGTGALVYVDVRALAFALGPGRRTAADISALFWHFLNGVWIYLLLLFSFCS